MERGEAIRARIAPTLKSIRVGDIVGAGERRYFQIGIGLFVVAALVPLVADGYALQLSISIVMYTALATSWLLFSGPTNYIALSTAAFFGIGMYTVAGGIDIIPYPLLIVLAAIAGAALAAVVGLATLRVSGVYFVIFSLGLAELVRQIMTWLQHVLGTMSGIYVLLDRSENVYYWELLLLAAAVYLVGWWIGRSRLGFALRIIGNDEVVAVHCGINTARAKVVLFVISSTFAAIAGAVVAPRWSYVEPGVAFSPFLSFQVVIMALLGGTHRLVGTAARRHSVRAHMGGDLDLFSQSDHAAARRLLPVDRLRHPERHHRSRRGRVRPPRHPAARRARAFAARLRRRGRLVETPAATLEQPQCLMPRPRQPRP